MSDAIKELRELLDKITPGEWGTAYRRGDDWNSVVYPKDALGDEICQCFHDPNNIDECEANTRFIAAARNAMPALLDEVERLRKALRIIANKRSGVLRHKGPDANPKEALTEVCAILCQIRDEALTALGDSHD